MTSRLLKRLDADIQSATRTVEADCLRCERAAYLARVGEFDAALRELTSLQQRHAARRDPSVSVWLMLAEGVLSHYRDVGPLAHDKVKRAHALSKAAGLKSLHALSAAWLAQLDHQHTDGAAIAQHAAEALRIAAADHHAARARASLVIAQSYHEGGRFDLARPWYEKAKRHVDAEGDDSTLGALIWNMASLRVTALRQVEACGTAADTASAFALLSAESTANFDVLYRVRSLQSLQPILRAQVCTALGQTDEALGLYENHLAAALEQGMAPIQGSLLADRAWCRLRAGKQAAAREDVAAAEACLDTAPTWPGDHAPAHSRLAQVFEALGDRAAMQRHADLAARTWAAHRTAQARLVDALNGELTALTDVA